MKTAIVFAAAPLALLAACSQASAPIDKEAILAEIRAVEDGQAVALNSADKAGTSAVYSDDAELFMVGRAPAIGIEAIQSMGEDVLADPALVVVHDEASKVGWVADSGELAVTGFTGTITMTNPATGEPETHPTANTTVWEKQSDGAWKMVRDVNTRPEVPMAS